MSTLPSLLKSNYRVRFTECDPFGHLNNSRYVDYMLNAREDHLRDGYALLLSDFLKQGIYWVVSGHEIQYKRPAIYNEVVCIVSALIEAGEQHLRVESQMWNETQTELKAVLWTRFTVVDAKTGRKSGHPEEFMAFARSVLYNEAVIEEGLSARVQALLQGVAGETIKP